MATDAEETHSLYSPSKAEQYILCPGSVALQYFKEDKAGKYAHEGTAAHKLAEMYLRREIDNVEEMLGQKISWIEHGEKIEWTVNDEMVDYIVNYTETILQRVNNMYKLPDVSDVHLHVEQRVDFSSLIEIPKQSGTADIIIEVVFKDGSLLLSVEDLKYGRGVEVYAQNNRQAMTYAAGVCDAYQFAGSTVREVHVAIHQVRLQHMSEAQYSLGELDDHVLELKTQAKIAEHQRLAYITGEMTAEQLTLRPGEKQCKFCSAKADCPALAKQALSEAFEDFEDLDVLENEDDPLKEPSVENVNAVSNKQLSVMLKKLPTVEMWVSAVYARAYSEIENGDEVPGYKLVEGRKGAREWADADEAENVLKSMKLKKDEMYSAKLISPTQAEKLLKNSPRRLNRIEPLFVQRDGKPTLVTEDNPKPGLNFNPASDFDDLDTADDFC